jgi:DNA replication protein DnaC
LNGNNILLYGQKGTGKDHLLSGLAKRVFSAGYKVVWISGPLLHDVAYQAINEREFGEEAYRNLIFAEFLWISDPTLAGAGLSPYQLEWMYKIIDHRTRFQSPTWMTANFRDQAAMEAQLGGPTADRIVDNALTFYCDWESYRGAV